MHLQSRSSETVLVPSPYTGKLRPMGCAHHYRGHFEALLRLFLEPSAWDEWPSFITIRGGYSWHQGKDMCALGGREPSVGLCSLSPGEGEFFPVGLSLLWVSRLTSPPRLSYTVKGRPPWSKPRLSS